MENEFQNIPHFLVALITILSNNSITQMTWNKDGVSFSISADITFGAEILPQYFKHNNVTSFVRQLNIYGFKSFQDGNKKCFHHKYFIRGKPELLKQIKRKLPSVANSIALVKQLTEEGESNQMLIRKMVKINDLLRKQLKTKTKHLRFYKRLVKEKTRRNYLSVNNNHVNCVNNNIHNDIDSHDYDNESIKIEPSINSSSDDDNIVIKIEPSDVYGDDDDGSWKTYISDLDIHG